MLLHAPTSKTINKIFVANRGEIVARIAKTATLLGIKTVAIARRPSPPLYLSAVVDEFHFVDDDDSSLYLDIEKLLAIAKRCGCDAVHAGYGFLAESTDFAKQTEASGLIWIGASHEAIEKMGNKRVAREIAEKAGVPVLEGISLPCKDKQASKQALENFCTQHSLPFIIKPSAGGGGKGMRTVHTQAELLPAVLASSREAQTLYQQAEVIVEKYITKPRHVEVQIVGDKAGNIIVLGDRECSVQRRFQKIIEEAPAPTLTKKQREKLWASALSLAKNVSYYSTGTVEFLLDAATGEFYFLEMNTRLQVEHTVTEEVFGVDLVAEQIKIASGKCVSAKNAEARGSSVQVRLYAEDVQQDFLPMPACVRAFIPFHTFGLRWEIGVDAEEKLSSAFDPMIAKVISTASTRESALACLRLALRQSFIAGIETNIAFLLAVLDDPAFLQAHLTTNYVQENLPALITKMQTSAESYQQMADAVIAFLRNRYALVTETGIATLFRLRDKETQQVKSPVLAHEVRTNKTVSGTGRYKNTLFRYVLFKEQQKSSVIVGIEGNYYCVEYVERQWQEMSHTHSDSCVGNLLSPLPGKVAAVNIKVGDKVKKGDTCVTIASMKMEFAIKATIDGKVDKVQVAVGVSVNEGDVVGIVSAC